MKARWRLNVDPQYHISQADSVFRIVRLGRTTGKSNRVSLSVMSHNLVTYIATLVRSYYRALSEGGFVVSPHRIIQLCCFRRNMTYRRAPAAMTSLYVAFVAYYAKIFLRAKRRRIVDNWKQIKCIVSRTFSPEGRLFDARRETCRRMRWRDSYAQDIFWLLRCPDTASPLPGKDNSPISELTYGFSIYFRQECASSIDTGTVD